MNGSIDQKNRRELLRAWGRHLALGGLAVFGGFAWIRTKNAPRDESCLKVDPCKVCQIYDNCSLPKALSAKARGKETNRAQSR